MGFRHTACATARAAVFFQKRPQSSFANKLIFHRCLLEFSAFLKDLFLEQRRVCRKLCQLGISKPQILRRHGVGRSCVTERQGFDTRSLGGHHSGSPIRRNRSAKRRSGVCPVRGQSLKTVDVRHGVSLIVQDPRKRQHWRCSPNLAKRRGEPWVVHSSPGNLF